MDSVNKSLKMKKRLGLSLIELVAAGTLVISGLTIIGKLSVASGRVWQQTRHEQVALEELSNQLERLLALPPPQRVEAISQLAPSAFAADMLPGANITVRQVEDADGERLELQIDWDRPVPSRPLRLVGWVDDVDGGRDAPLETAL